MPVSTFTGLQTSLRGLIAQQEALDTTAHNIANASTKGYSRQEVLLSASRALSIVTGSPSSDSMTAMRSRRLIRPPKARLTGVFEHTRLCAASASTFTTLPT